MFFQWKRKADSGGGVPGGMLEISYPASHAEQSSWPLVSQHNSSLLQDAKVAVPPGQVQILAIHV